MYVVILASKWRDSILFMIHMYDTTVVYVRHASSHVAHTHACCSWCCRVLQCVAVHVHIIRICLCECVCTTWRMCMCDMIGGISYILIRTCTLDSCFCANVYVRHDMMHVYMWHDSYHVAHAHDQCVCATWRIDMTNVYVRYYYCHVAHTRGTYTFAHEHWTWCE